MYKVLVKKYQIFDDSYTVYDVIAHFAELADLKTHSADMLFYKGALEKHQMAVITKDISDNLKEADIDPKDKAYLYVKDDYPYIKEDDVGGFVNDECMIDTPVINADFVPKYVILKGYKKTDRSEHYMCNVLSGTSTYNLSVNADMSVSCNCMLRMAGYLGDLRKQTIEDIYESELVCNMRKLLGDGVLPTVSCWLRCTELKQVPKSMAKYYERHYSVPKHILFENTSICNLRCKGCYNNYISKTTVTSQDTERFALQAASNGMKTIHFFKYGEPFADDSIKEKLEIIRKYNPDVKIITSSNGLLLNKHREAALLLDVLIISLDGVDDYTISKFQVNGDFSKAYENIKDFIQQRDCLKKKLPLVTWKYVLFPHNQSDEYIKKAFMLAKDANVDRLHFFTGFNTEVSADALWKSNVFEQYMERYRFSFLDGTLCFELSN